MMDGTIDKVTSDNNSIPSQNNMSNFGTGYGYQYGPDEESIEVKIDDEWWVFKKYK